MQNSPPLISTKSVNKYKFANGLTLLLEVNRNAPVISLYMGVKVGSRCETDRIAGLSHVLEHMVFKGTQNFGPGEIAAIVEASGGELNAYTSFDQTVYFINLSSRSWLKGLNLIREMVSQATIDREELAREQEVIVEEIRRGKDNPHNQLSEELFRLAYSTHPYGRPVIGFEKTVRSFTQQEVAGFYRRWYAPNNMILGICGDFDSREVKKAVAKGFGRLKRMPLSPPRPKAPFASNGKGLITRITPFKGNYLGVAFPITPFRHRDTASLDLLSHILGGGETSRLVQVVKEKKKLATTISSAAYTPVEPGLFIVDALVPDAHVGHIWPAIVEEIHSIQKKGPSAEALLRAKTNIQSSLYYEKETCEGTARKWISYETTTGDFRYEEKYLEDVRKAGPEDVKRVACHYLKIPRAKMVLLHAGAGDVSSAGFSLSAKKTARKPYKRADAAFGIKKFILPNGMTICTRENQRLPIMSVRAVGLGGLRFEDKKSNGLSNLTAHVLEKGTTTKNYEQVAEITEAIAGHFSADAGRNSWGLSAGFLSEKTETGLELFCDLLVHPAFSPEECEKEKRVVLEAIKNEEDSPAHMAFQKFQAALFPKHPYGLPLLGTKKTVSALSSGDLTRFYSKNLNPEKIVLAASGDFQSERLIGMLTDRLGGLKNRGPAFSRCRPDPSPRTVHETRHRQEKKQAHIVLGFMGATLTSPDRYALEVLNNILSGQGGRLFLTLRDRESLAYSVTSVLTEGIEPGFFAVYIGTEPKKVDQAVKGILRELKKVCAKPVPEKELKRAQHYITGNYELDLQRNSAVTSTLAFDELYGQGFREIKNYPKKVFAVTSRDVHRAAQKYLRLDAYVLSIVGP